MSLLRQRKEIEQAVAGLLPPEDEQKLRAHLKGCTECRRHYDLLTMQARMLAGGTEPAKGADDRELARLMAGMAPKPVPARSRGWLPALAFAAACAALFLVVFGLPKPGPSEPEVVWRGAVDAGASEPDFALSMFAAPLDGGKLEQKATFPLDATARLSRDQWVAFAPHEVSRKFGYFRAILVPEHGEPLILESGHSLSLDPGRWRVYGLLAVRSTNERLKKAVAAAEPGARRLPLEEGIQSYGEIVVEP